MVTASPIPADGLTNKVWPKTPEADEFRYLLRTCRAPKLRTMREFAEQEIILPDGPFKGLRFRCDRQPYSALYFEQVAAGGWRIINATGPSQSGKTLTCTLIPLLYHLFEQRETVVFGLPDKDMAGDKWEVDILPVLEKTRYRDLLPLNGEGSRGGKVRDLVKFRNGAILKFMSAGGNDKERAHFTTRVLIITETDAFGVQGQISTESSKYEQLLARIRSFDDQAIVYQECTLTVETGITWQNHTQGTESRIVSPCPHCGHYIAPDREQLVGWQTAANEVAARLDSVYQCPREECGEGINEVQRKRMLANARLIHRGQQITPAGEIIGKNPPTHTLGFRWTAFDNLLMSAGTIAVDEWKAARDPNEDAAERKLCQFVWARPYKPDQEEAIELDANKLTTRLGRWPRGLIPRETVALTCGIDLGLHLAHWVTIAWLPGFGGHCVDYGRFEVPGRDLGPDRAIEIALRTASEGFLALGWPQEGSGEARTADLALIDIGYQQDAVFRFLRSLPADQQQRYRAAKGYGAGRFRAERYTRPKATSNQVLAIGDMFHVARYASEQSLAVEFSADYWKSFVHARLATELAGNGPTPGALSLFATSPREHLTLAKHLTAERRIFEFVPGEGDIERWKRVHKNNHYLDGFAMAAVGGSWCGVQLSPREPQPTAAGEESGGLTLPDGRPFFVLDR
jgi:hypothetical protein